MAKNIDENIVKMTFDNKDFEKNANHTISVIDKLKSSLDFSKSAKSFGDLEKAASGLNFKGVTDGIKDVADQSLSLLDQVKEKIITGFGLEIGKQLYNVVNNATVGAFKASWGVYEQMINAEQTIMSAVSGKQDNLTGLEYTIEGVQKRLDKLSWYTDETSYNMTQMTNAIANFTSSGIDLDSATGMIIGISNACADAGLNAEKADIAYTAFSKAIGSGAMTLGVWNNQLKTSGLINSERFKQSLLDAGEAAGVLKKGLDGVYKTTSKTMKAGETVSLADMTGALTNSKWMNKAVLEDVLNMYSSTSDALNQLVSEGKITSETKDIQNLTEALAKQGKTLADVGLEKKYVTTSAAISAMKEAYKTAGLEIPKSLAAMGRAQEATTITQALESVRVASSSKWRQIYEEIFGNYEEAKQLWTSLANEAYEWFVSPFDGVIEVLDEWHTTVIEVGEGSSRAFKTTGYELFSNTLQKIFGNVTSVLTTFREALGNVFGEFSVEGLVNLTKGFSNFIDKITLTDEQLGLLRNGLEGFFSIIKIFTDALGAIWNDGIKPIFEALRPLGEAVLELFSNLGLVATGLEEDIESSGVFSKVVKGITDVIITLIGYVTELVNWLNSLFATTEEGEKSGFAAFFEKIGDIIGVVLDKISKLAEGIRPIIEWIRNTLRGLWEDIKVIFQNISSGINNTLTQNGTEIGGLAAGGGIFAFLLTAADKLKKFDLGKTIDKALGGIGKITDALKGLFDELKNFLKIKGQVAVLEAIGKALLELAAALFIVSLIPTDKLVGSLTALIGSLIAITMILEYIGNLKSDTGNIKLFSRAMKSIGFALVELSVALLILGQLDIDQMGVALVGLLGTLALVFAFILGLNKVFNSKESKPENIIIVAEAMKSIGFALIEMAAALAILTLLDTKKMFIALGAVATLLAEMLLFVFAIKFALGKGENAAQNFKEIAGGMFTLGVALIAMSAALAILSTLDTGKMFIAIGAIATLMTALTFLTIIISAIPGGIGGLLLISIAGGLLILSEAMIVAAVGFAAFAVVIQIFEKIGWKVLLANIAKLGVLALGILAASTILGVAAIPLAAFGAAAIVLGLGLIAIGNGLQSMLGALTVFALLGEDAGDVLLNMLETMVKAVVAAIPMMILGIIDGITSVLTAILNFLVKTVGTIIKAVCTAVIDNIPLIIETLVTVVSALIQGLTDLLPVIGDFLVTAVGFLVDIAFKGAIAAINALANNIGELVNSLLNLVNSTINALADGIRNNAEGFGAAIANLATAIVDGLVGAIKGVVGGVGDWFMGLFSEDNTEESIEKAKETGATTVSEFGNSMEAAAEAKGGAYDKANTIEETVTDNMDGKADATVSGKNTLSGLDAGLGDPEWLNSIRERGKTAGATFMEGYNSEMSIASPSKEMKKEGGFTIKGLLLGIEDQFKNIAEAGYTAGSIALESMREAIAESNKLVEDGEMSPVITPVLDLSQVNEGLNGLNGSILQNGELASTIGLNTKTMSNQLQPQQNTFNIDFNIDNGGKDITEADISSWSRKIVQLVNTELGMKMS